MFLFVPKEKIETSLKQSIQQYETESKNLMVIIYLLFLSKSFLKNQHKYLEKQALDCEKNINELIVKK